MELTINGKSVMVTEGATIATFLADRGLNAKMVVVEYNGEIVARAKYDEVRLQPGDIVEIVQMMAGG